LSAFSVFLSSSALFHGLSSSLFSPENISSADSAVESSASSVCSSDASSITFSYIAISGILVKLLRAFSFCSGSASSSQATSSASQGASSVASSRSSIFALLGSDSSAIAVFEDRSSPSQFSINEFFSNTLSAGFVHFTFSALSHSCSSCTASQAGDIENFIDKVINFVICADSGGDNSLSLSVLGGHDSRTGSGGDNSVFDNDGTGASAVESSASSVSSSDASFSGEMRVVVCTSLGSSGSASSSQATSSASAESSSEASSGFTVASGSCEASALASSQSITSKLSFGSDDLLDDLVNACLVISSAFIDCSSSCKGNQSLIVNNSSDSVVGVNHSGLDNSSSSAMESSAHSSGSSDASSEASVSGVLAEFLRAFSSCSGSASSSQTASSASAESSSEASSGFTVASGSSETSALASSKSSSSPCQFSINNLLDNLLLALLVDGSSSALNCSFSVGKFVYHSSFIP